MTLEEYRRTVGWSISELARQAGIDFNTAKKALRGESIAPRTANALANALGRALQRPITVADIKDLNVDYL